MMESKVETLVTAEDVYRRATQAFAVPGSDSIVDMVNPDTGRTVIFGKTLEDVRREHPDAEVVELDEWSRQKAARQDAPVAWEPTTEQAYEEALCVLPPIAHCRAGFLVGEPWDHHATTGVPRYQAFRRLGDGRYVRSSRPMTVREFRAAIA